MRFLPVFIVVVVIALWSFVAGVELQRWYIIKHCGATGIYVIGREGFGMIGGGCNVLPPGLYEVKRIQPKAELP